MSILDADQLKKRLESEILKIDGDVRLLPQINNSNDNAEPFIEVDNYGYSYVCRERGNEIFRKMPYGIDELIFEVFRDVTRKMASDWELRNRNEKEDFRRKLFKRQIDLMIKINQSFNNKISGEINQLLKFAPYKD